MFGKELIVFRRYGVLGTLRLARDVVLSRILIRNVRLVRYPWYIRGGQHVIFGNNFTSGVGLRIDAFGQNKAQIVFGRNVQVGDYVHVAAMASIVLGDNVLVASKVYISDHDHGCYSGIADLQSKSDEIQINKRLAVSPVVIGNNVWLGENVCVLKGVEIGRNSIIGASSVVTRSVPPDSIAVGNPARVVKRFDYSALCWVNVKGS